jgi:pilus assembly protein TadC
LRAVTRLIRRGELVPDAHLRERPVIAMIVALPAVLGLLLVCAVIRVWIDSQPWGTDAGGPLAGAAALSLLFTAFAVLTGELVLVGRSAPVTG